MKTKSIYAEIEFTDSTFDKLTELVERQRALLDEVVNNAQSIRGLLVNAGFLPDLKLTEKTADTVTINCECGRAEHRAASLYCGDCGRKLEKPLVTA